MNSNVSAKHSRCVTKRTEISSLDDQTACSSNQENINLEQEQEEKEINYHYQMKRTVYLSTLPRSIGRSELMQFFAGFGTIRTFQLGVDSVVAEFYDSQTTELLINRSDWLPNEQLDIKRGECIDCKICSSLQVASQATEATYENNSANPQEDTDSISFEYIYKTIEHEIKFEDELEMLLRTIELPNRELKMRYNGIGSHLNKIIRKIFPNCRTYKFGSIVAKLGLKGSDLDMYVDIGTDVSLELQEPTQLNQTLFIFKKVKKAMYKKPSIFGKIVPIPKARTPIIRFHYLPTDVSCDITFKDSLGIYKTNFLKYCVFYEPRVKPLMILIKYWAKVIRITEKFSNYGLMMLIIFYLQQADVLPSLVKLRENCEPQLVEGWQVNFNENSTLPPTTNIESIAELFHSFLSYYSTFDFKKRVLCVLDGKIYTSAEIAAKDELPDYMDTYKECIRNATHENMKKKLLNYNKPICVQDPIELNQNTLAALSYNLKFDFQTFCKNTAEVCETVRVNDYDNLLKAIYCNLSKITTKGYCVYDEIYGEDESFLTEGLAEIL